MSQDSFLILVTKGLGSLCFCIDFLEIPNLHVAVKLLDDTQSLEQHLVHLEFVIEIRRQSLQQNEAHRKIVQASFDCHINPCTFTEGELVLCYDVAKEVLGPRNFKTLWK